MTLLTRRSILTGIATSLLAAPAIVRVASLMPIKALPPNLFCDAFDQTIDLLRRRMNEAYAVAGQNMATNLYGAIEYAPVTFTGFQSLVDWPLRQLAITIIIDRK